MLGTWQPLVLLFVTDFAARLEYSSVLKVFGSSVWNALAKKSFHR